MIRIVVIAAAALVAAGASAAKAREPSSMSAAQTLTADQRAVMDLDTRFQAAVKANDAATQDAILHPDYILITGRGALYTRAEQLRDAREKTTVYEIQDEEEQYVRVTGDTAVVTALLHIKGVRGGTQIDYRLWFSDTYVRTPAGWKYFVGQASLPLPGP